MKKLLSFTFLFSLALLALGNGSYDFRATAAYRELAAPDRQRLEQVQRDLVLLWGALDMYADQHDGNPPATLDDLAPRFLAELPADPFRGQTELRNLDKSGYVVSKGGMGYGYRKGSDGNRAWIVASAGLPEFPYLAETGNVGLYQCKGTWISGKNPLMRRER